MGYETALNQLQEHGGGIDLSPEAASPYAELGHAALIDRFYETEGNPDVGEALSVRLFVHAGFTDDPRVTPLVGRDGVQIQKDGRPLMLADYVNFAAGHHFDALEDILDFLLLKPGQQDYETARAAMLSRLSAGKG